MARDQTVRRRIVEYLTEHGPVRDASGRATALLKDAVGYEGSDTGFTQLVSAMAKSGNLMREVRGKRTYRVSLSSSPPPATTATAVPRRLGRRAHGLRRARSRPTRPSYEAPLRSVGSHRVGILGTTPPRTARPRNTALQREVARAKAELEAAIIERDALSSQLEAAQRNLSLLTDRLSEPRTSWGRAAERLGTDEQTLLYQLRGRHRPSTATPERVS